MEFSGGGGWGKVDYGCEGRSPGQLTKGDRSNNSLTSALWIVIFLLVSVSSRKGDRFFCS
ncbi:MAG: hypothetical protein LH628_06560 [Microcoleus sp. CAN_BIN18]|nr:hypothetical protein [Microcoleus sp. CAN_BIN18]